jgi:hypothetical protein
MVQPPSACRARCAAAKGGRRAGAALTQYLLASGRCSDQRGVYWFGPPEVAFPPTDIRFIVVGLAPCNWDSSWRFSWSA